MIASPRVRQPAWCCIQAGHREQYAIPRALHRAGALERLLTDIWLPPNSVLAKMAVGSTGRRLRDRFHGDLAAATVADHSWRSLTWETTARVRGWRGSDLVLRHNAWWMTTATRALAQLDAKAITHVFSYSYEACAVFAAAEQRGLTTVLGQIDPGPVEDAKVHALVRKHQDYRTSFQPSGTDYYASWREECARADHIVVNSAWSKRALVTAGIDEEKIAIIPLVYVPPREAHGWRKSYPEKFSASRPLRLVFLGQCILRKGVAELIAAARRFIGRPVEFTLVGNTDIADLEKHFDGARISYRPRVSRRECQEFYRDADAFLFPTHSDGFGLTQLEAQAWRLPIMASSYCAEVVRDGETGWVLPEVSADAIERVIESMLAAPQSLARCSEAIQPWPFGLEELGKALTELGSQPARP